MTLDKARVLLAIVLYDRSDIQLGWSKASYGSVLARACMAVGLPAKTVPEDTARKVLERAYRAAVAEGLHGAPFAPAGAAANVLRAASRAKR